MNIDRELDNIRKSFNAIMNHVIAQYPAFSRSSVSAAVCRVFEISESDLTGTTKKGVIGEARLAYAYLLYYHVSKNKSEISRWMGRKDSHSAIEAIARAEDLILLKDKLFAGKIGTCLSILKSTS